MDRAGVTAAVGVAGRPDAHGAARTVRGVLASSAAVLAACAGHVAAGGAMPAPVLLTAVLVLSWLPGVALIGVTVRLWRQAAVIVVAEAMLHGVLALQRGGGTGAGTPDRWNPSAGMPGMAGTGAGHPTGSAHQIAAHLAAATPVPVPVPVPVPMSHGVAMPAWMWIAHAAAAAVTVLLWRRGEADAARIVAVAGRGLSRLMRIPGPLRLTEPAATRPLVVDRLGRAIEAVRTAHPHRGPPLAV